MTHSTLIRSIVAAFALALSFSARAQAPEELPELTPALARNLLAQAQEIAESQIDVAYVLGGEKALKKGFSSSSAAVAIYLATRLEDGQRRRRCHEQIFLWNPQFGWFLEEVIEEPTRDYLRIWTEKQGFLEIR